MKVYRRDLARASNLQYYPIRGHRLALLSESLAAALRRSIRLQRQLLQARRLAYRCTGCAPSADSSGCVAAQHPLTTSRSGKYWRVEFCPLDGENTPDEEINVVPWVHCRPE